MNEKASSAIQKAQQERKRGLFSKAVKRLEQAIAMFPDELDLYLEVIDACIEGGELIPATNFLKTAQDKFSRERERMTQFVREKLKSVHDPSLARCIIEHAVKRRDLEEAMDLMAEVPDHTIRDLLNRAKTKMQSLKSASHGGHTLRGETVTNELTNALLSLRLGNLKEATTTLVKIIEDKPVEHRMLEPFLASLEAKHPKSGRLRFARGCALREASSEAESIQHFIDAARLEPGCAAACVEKLKAMREHARHPGKVQRALAEVQLIKGDLDDAAATLRDYLGTNPDNAREVIMVLRPFIDASHELTSCTCLAIETALSLEQSSLALEILRPIQQRAGNSPELFEWLEAKATDGILPPDVMMFHGSLALEQKQFERAGEIFGGLCAKSPQDTPAVLSLIDRHRSAHPSLEALHDKYAAESAAGDAAVEAEGDFQSFENSEFHLEKSEAFESSASRSPAKPPKAPFAKRPGFSKPAAEAGGGATAGGQPSARKSFIDARELSLDEETTPVVATTNDASPATDPGPVRAAATIEITESHVANVGQQLYAVGAAAFFHIEGGSDASPEPDGPAPSPDAYVEPPARKDPPPSSRGPESAEPAPFAEEFQRFTRGELGNAAVVALMERALQDGRVDELQELLCFEPGTGAEYFARYYYQAEYHALRNLPLQALEILAKLDTPDLDDEHRQRVWFKIAACQRMLHNYAGANDTLSRLVEHFPDHPEYARLKRRNHEQFLAEQSLTATVLEKTSTLD